MGTSTDAPTRTLAEVLALHPLADLAWRAASEAGRFLLTERPDELSVESKSTPTDVVTSMDKAAEHLLFERLLGERPGDGLMGEEGSDRASETGIRWIVDPLDGTVNYLYRIPLWGVSVAAEDQDLGATVVGVIVTPETGEGFIGIRGAGAWRVVGDVCERLYVRHCTSLGQTMVATGFCYEPDIRAEQAMIVQRLISRVRDIRRTGCAVVDFTWLASGRTDAYYEAHLNVWDVAAGLLIAREAGAEIGAFGPKADPGSFLVAVPGIAKAFQGALDECSAGLGFNKRDA
ncbi:MAG: inositol monophosphatase family protein [Actinomycetota bacterium]|nr:inositol monophosphatase family protein [Actinomycetota bacterium]